MAAVLARSCFDDGEMHNAVRTGVVFGCVDAYAGSHAHQSQFASIAVKTASLLQTSTRSRHATGSWRTGGGTFHA